MRRLLAWTLLLSLLLAGCAADPAPSGVTPEQAAQSVLNACREVETERLSGATLSLWLREIYGLPEDSWSDCALYRAADPMYAFEIAVIRRSEKGDPEEICRRLEEYLLDRQGDFVGYDPEQAAIVEGSTVSVSDSGRFVALLICKDNARAQAAFLAAADDGVLAEPSHTPAPDPTASPEPTFTAAPEPDPMAIYDTSAIIGAWNSGTFSHLSDYDMAILLRCREILSGILRDGMSDLEKETAIYQWVVSNVAYDYDHYNPLTGASPHSSTPYNPLMEGKGICMGFASTFQLLADLSGVESIIIPGKAFSEREDHAWNMVRLDGTWYFVDPTWDTGVEDPRFWRYFNVSAQYMTETDHQWDYENYPDTAADDGSR